MRFLVDAQLPRRLAVWLNNAGHLAVHTLHVPEERGSGVGLNDEC